MKNFITLVLFSAMCVACATARQAAPSEKIITETRIETVFQTDTVFLEVPRIVEKIFTKDTVSVVEKELSRWQTFKMKTGGITLTILSLLALAAIG